MASTFMTLANLEAEVEAVLKTEADEVADEKTRRGTGGIP